LNYGCFVELRLTELDIPEELDPHVAGFAFTSCVSLIVNSHQKVAIGRSSEWILI
jgi:hypothetical protein